MITQFEIINLPAAYILLALFALVIGSLLNVIIYRLPLMIASELRSDYAQMNHLPEQAERSVNLFFPRSFCPSCKTTVSARFNIPILGYLLLGGRCRECKNTISLRYPLVECLSCILSLFAAWQFGFTLSLIFVLAFIWILIALFFIDLEQLLLPDSLTLGLLWLGLIVNTQGLFTNLTDAVLSAAAAYLCLWFFMQLYYLLRGKIGMGHGDFKLLAAFGAWFGWVQLPLILLLASLAGAVIGLIYLKSQRKTKETPIPFGPFLCTAGVASLFWGKLIMGWYLGLWLV